MLRVSLDFVTKRQKDISHQLPSVVKFTKLIESSLKENKCQIIKSPHSEIEIVYHRVNVGKRQIDFKIGYVPNLFYFNTRGYSGWSNIPRNPHKDVTPEEANVFYQNKIIPLIQNKITKYDQPAKASLPIQDYILVTTQVQNDTVMKLKYYETTQMIDHAIQIGKRLKKKVVIKMHPKNASNHAIERYVSGKDVIISHDNVLDLIEKSNCVFTINSGTGFESLMRLKKVVVFGKSDYEGACFRFNGSDVDASNYILSNTNEEMIKRFLCGYYKYMIDINEPEEIVKKEIMRRIRKHVKR